MPTILLLGTGDTKWSELLYLHSQLTSNPSISVLLMDVGRAATSSPLINIPHPSLNNNKTIDYTQLSRNDYIQTITHQSTPTVADLYHHGKIHSILAIGGSCGTTIATAIMRDALPIGFPKLMVSTMASGDVGPYIQETDITMMYSVVDVAGTNSILNRILRNAAAAGTGMATSYCDYLTSETTIATNGHTKTTPKEQEKKTKIGITMFGVTTPAVTQIRSYLESHLPNQCEIYVFHATGSGGKAMERLIREQQLDAIVDLTTSEIVDELAGGVLSAGPGRLEAAAGRGIPQVVSVGACDMINFGTKDTIPERFKGRRIYEHNPTVTIVRTDEEENRRVGEFIVGKLRKAKWPGNVVVMLPTGGVSMMDVPGNGFYDGDADEVLFGTVERGLEGSGVRVVRSSNMSRSLEGKFAIITGGSRGIGEAIAHNLASKGCSLLLNYTSDSSRARTESLCNTLSTTHKITCIPVQADLSDPAPAVNTIISAAKTHFTSPTTNTLTIDILINNAGVSKDRFLNDPSSGPIDPAYFNWHYTINVLAPLLLTQACAEYLPRKPAHSGRIINISSISSSLGFTGQSVYGGTKAALEAMTRTWARELADVATVNAVNPGPVVGDMYFATGEEFWKQMQGFQDNTPLSKLVDGEEAVEELLSEEQKRLIREKMGGRRPAFTREIAGVVGMLCTEDGAWCTGSVVCANGGLKFTT
ncbi:UPF0261-domain-containing protein [Aspergillus welwitschiae]|uniref:UPF0261-domain-containing protein n=1 Tax=Aspergillus welwitschiae TaxID=1341132 RepID=A0A3F3PJN2_9EURO|nr:UPF0261-domain-containing protein [Aspergillus welwitschiae]RDH27150.1 UPF0261-domain-containing protein [Aspergillus welwitschiae]